MFDFVLIACRHRVPDIRARSHKPYLFLIALPIPSMSNGKSIKAYGPAIEPTSWMLQVEAFVESYGVDMLLGSCAFLFLVKSTIFAGAYYCRSIDFAVIRYMCHNRDHLI